MCIAIKPLYDWRLLWNPSDNNEAFPKKNPSIQSRSARFFDFGLSTRRLSSFLSAIFVVPSFPSLPSFSSFPFIAKATTHTLSVAKDLGEERWTRGVSCIFFADPALIVANILN